jgi:hypothetical protein
MLQYRIGNLIWVVGKLDRFKTLTGLNIFMWFKCQKFIEIVVIKSETLRSVVNSLKNPYKWSEIGLKNTERR